jgi:alanine racemase
VKAQGYGSGSHEVASVLQDLGVDYLGVAYADEGVALREAGIKTPIMVLNTDAYTLELLDKYQLEPVIYSTESLKDYVLERNGKPGKIHIEIDTGMHRLGFEERDLNDAIELMPSNIRVQSVFTHFSVSEEAERDGFTQKQAYEFLELASWLERNLEYPFLKHICNTAGIIRFKEFHLDMVRLGLGLYGLDPSGRENEKLQPTAALYAVITQMHQVEAGNGIGYGQNDVADHKRRIATISMGYADGLSRIYSRGVGRVYVNGKLALFVGNICMDMAMIDVTDIDCSEGEKVEIFGPHLSIHDVARWGNTISYEILTGISQRVPRIFIGE